MRPVRCWRWARRPSAVSGPNPGQASSAIRPMKDGVIADFDVTREMIKYFFDQGPERSSRFRPNLVIGVPSGITMVEKTGGSRIRPGSRGPGYLLDRRAHGGGHRRRPGGPGSAGPTWWWTSGAAPRRWRSISLFATAYCESIRVAGRRIERGHHLPSAEENIDLARSVRTPPSRSK